MFSRQFSRCSRYAKIKVRKYPHRYRLKKVCLNRAILMKERIEKREEGKDDVDTTNARKNIHVLTQASVDKRLSRQSPVTY